jgi:hypothetical protein
MSSTFSRVEHWFHSGREAFIPGRAEEAAEKTLAQCHPEPAEGSALLIFQKDTADASLRSA